MNMAYLWVALGGSIGSVSRYWVDGLVQARMGNSFPWGVLLINITGSFLIGFIGAMANPDGRMDPRTRMFATQFLMIGVCGGYTTFSSFSWRTLQFIQDRQWLQAGGNILLSVVLCLIGVWLGYLLGTLLSSTKGN